MSDITKTPREELECKKKYLYEHSMFWGCNDGSKCQILEDDVCDLLNEQQATINKLQGDINRLQYIIEELRKDNYKRFEKINELKAQLREKEEDERLYANEIVKLNKEAKEVLDFKSLGGDY